MIVIIVGTVIGTVGGVVAVHYLRIWLRKVARRDKAKAGRLGEL